MDLYPPPKFNKIIEPFAGTARYSLKFFENDILLVDKYETVVSIWKFLQKCSKEDILKLPRMKEGESLDDYKFDCPEQRLLMGFLVAKSVQSPRKTASARATTSRPNHINFQLKSIASNLFKIKHWEVRLGSYDDIKNEKGTWFIDPPYEHGGYVYIKNNKGWDYSKLAKWCKSRKGQVIVCENTKASWLPFMPMTKMRGSRHETVEAIWSNYETPFDFQQMNLL